MGRLVRQWGLAAGVKPVFAAAGSSQSTRLWLAFSASSASQYFARPLRFCSHIGQDYSPADEAMGQDVGSLRLAGCGLQVAACWVTAARRDNLTKLLAASQALGQVG
jgi:hypothetical protein